MLTRLKGILINADSKARQHEYHPGHGEGNRPQTHNQGINCLLLRAT